MVADLHPVDLHVANRLRIIRQGRGLSVDDLAKALGIAYQNVQRYETGKARLVASRLKQLADILHVSVNDFFLELPQDGEPIEAKPIDLALLRMIIQVQDHPFKRALLEVLAQLADSYGYRR